MKCLALIGIVVLIMTVFTGIISLLAFRQIKKRINKAEPFKNKAYTGFK